MSRKLGRIGRTKAHKKRNVNHIQALKNHATRKIKQRVWIKADPCQVYDLLRKAIVSGDAKQTGCSETRSAYEYGLDGRAYRIIWDHKKHVIVTVINLGKMEE